MGNNDAPATVTDNHRMNIANTAFLQGENDTGRSRIRTGDKRICNPSLKPAQTLTRTADNSKQSNPCATRAQQTDIKNASLEVPANVLADRDFLTLARAWPTLPAALKAGIVAMIKAANGEGGK